MSLTTAPLERGHQTTPGKRKGTRSSGRHDVQGLRAVAVLAVVLNHLLEGPRGGFVGVDVFFVISGFLITGLLLREHDRTGPSPSSTSTGAGSSGSCRRPSWCWS